MTTQQFSQALQIAQSKEDLSLVDDLILDGCGLPGFQPVTVTLKAAARFIRWQCICLNGQVDSEALNEMRAISRRKWIVV